MKTFKEIDQYVLENCCPQAFRCSNRAACALREQASRIRRLPRSGSRPPPGKNHDLASLTDAVQQ
jgi:hypothetical protein